MTVPTTLLEELEQAAVDADVLADWFASPSAGKREKGAATLRARAAALRARAERVRELLDLAHKQKFDGGRRELARALIGPLPSPPGTGNGGR